MFGNIHSRIRNAQYTEMFSCVQEPPLIASPPEVDWCGRLLGHTREETTICIKGVPGDFVVDQPEHTDNEAALCKAFDAHQLHEPSSTAQHPPVEADTPPANQSSSVNTETGKCQNFVVHQPEYTDNEEALCKAFDAHHLHEPSSTAQHPPVEANTPSANQSSGVNTETGKCQRAVTNLFDCDHVVNFHSNLTTKHRLPLADRDLDQWRSFLTSEAHANLAEEVIKHFQAEARELTTRDAKAIRISFKICRCKVVEPETQKYIKCTVFTGLTETTIPQRQQSCRLF